MKGTNIYILYTYRRNWYAYYIIHRYRRWCSGDVYRSGADDHCTLRFMYIIFIHFLFFFSLCSSRWFYRAYLINDTLIINFPFTRIGLKRVLRRYLFSSRHHTHHRTIDQSVRRTINTLPIISYYILFDPPLPLRITLLLLVEGIINKKK